MLRIAYTWLTIKSYSQLILLSSLLIAMIEDSDKYVSFVKQYSQCVDSVSVKMSGKSNPYSYPTAPKNLWQCCLCYQNMNFVLKHPT